MDPILCVAYRVGNSQVPRSRVSLSLYLANSIRRVWVAGKYFGVRKISHLADLSTAKVQAIKNPPKRVCTKTIPTPCRLPSRRWSIVPDPGELLVHQLLDPILRLLGGVANSQCAIWRVSLSLYVCGIQPCICVPKPCLESLKAPACKGFSVFRAIRARRSTPLHNNAARRFCSLRRGCAPHVWSTPGIPL